MPVKQRWLKARSDWHSTRILRESARAKAKNLTLAAPRDRLRGCRAAESPAWSRPEGSARAYRGQHPAEGTARHRISPAGRRAIPARVLSWFLAARRCLRAEQPRSACSWSTLHGRDLGAQFALGASPARAAPAQRPQQATPPARRLWQSGVSLSWNGNGAAARMFPATHRGNQPLR